MSLMSKFAGFVLRYNIIKAIFGGDIYDLHMCLIHFLTESLCYLNDTTASILEQHFLFFFF